ncbi:Zinc finger MYND domain-containing protein 10 [Coccomyxa sp. Obi]|nr:Zinc finger MYND domain-containing protein 10 [Coccomyxa sp. Obi]
MDQQEKLDRINLQAHQSAQSRTDEFVVDALVSSAKISLLLHQQLVIEVWKGKVLDHLEEHLVNSVDSLTCYQLLYSEAVLANLLEVCLYHEHACQAMSEDALLELCDWCYRKLTFLNTCSNKVAAQEPGVIEYHVCCEPANAQDLLARQPKEDLQEQKLEVEFKTALCALTIVRYLTDHVNSVALGLATRLISTNDTISALIPLLERPPWRRRVKKQSQGYQDGQWQKLEPEDRLKLTLHEAQVWLALSNLLVDPSCRAKVLQQGTHYSESLLRLRRHMNEILLDQLPVLADLQRVLDELALGCAGVPYAANSTLIIEQVPMIRARILEGKDWRALAEEQKRNFFGAKAAAVSELRMQSMLRNLEAMLDMQPDLAADKENAAGKSNVESEVKVKVWSQVKEGVYELWTDMVLRIDSSKAPEPLEGVQVQGTRPLPCNGKAVAIYGGSTAEARFTLPVASTQSACTTELALVGWLTIGHLATDGFAVQLKLLRADKPQLRDKTEGGWLAYHIAGGAITVRDTGKSGEAPEKGNPRGPLDF